jgi:hypothetical protein
MSRIVKFVSAFFKSWLDVRHSMTFFFGQAVGRKEGRNLKVRLQMDTTIRDLNQAREQWTRQWRLLEQLSKRVFEMDFNDTYEHAANQVRGCLDGMLKVVEALPKNAEPFGPGYLNALSGIHAVLDALQTSSKLLEKCAKNHFMTASEAGWSRALQSTMTSAR